MSAITKRCIISALLRAILLRGHGVVRCDQEFISSAVYLAFMFAAFPCPDLDLELRQGLLPRHRGEVRRDGEEVCGLIGARPEPLTAFAVGADLLLPLKVHLA